ncbi:MAG: 3-deoxy-manno-octulosonate cytidylyltransferase [Bacteroidaceae bacterium]|nr:3-deoxy-manno-octulosonate cytidylyltransferase [Bacteroidaceae bacterium]
MTFIGIIPARYASTRFPAKPLAKLCGKTVIEHVYKAVESVLDEAVVATDDERICDAVKAFGGKAVMTSIHHKSGTDRVDEAYKKWDKEYDVVVNIQGDEPLIQPSHLLAIQHCFDHPKTQIATLVKPFTSLDGWTALENPNFPKVVLDDFGRALYFSRSVIPYLRDVDRSEWLSMQTFYKHIGLYAYRPAVLAEITALPPSPLEMAESLEQLRWLQAGYHIQVGITQEETISIDTPEDLARAEVLLKTKMK